MFINILKTLHMANLALVYKRSKKKKRRRNKQKNPKTHRYNSLCSDKCFGKEKQRKKEGHIRRTLSKVRNQKR